VPATSAGLPRIFFLLWALTLLMKQTRQAVCAVKQSNYLDVYVNILVQGTTEREGLGTVDLLIKVAHFVKKVNNVCCIKSR
jgi:hypothetical protein